MKSVGTARYRDVLVVPSTPSSSAASDRIVIDRDSAIGILPTDCFRHRGGDSGFIPDAIGTSVGAEPVVGVATNVVGCLPNRDGETAIGGHLLGGEHGSVCQTFCAGEITVVITACRPWRTRRYVLTRCSIER